MLSDIREPLARRLKMRACSNCLAEVSDSGPSGVRRWRYVSALRCTGREKAGVVLKPAPVKRLSKADSSKHLAKDSAATLHTYMGRIQRFDQPGFTERKKLN
jgi:hypothetical protein